MAFLTKIKEIMNEIWTERIKETVKFLIQVFILMAATLAIVYFTK